MSERSEFSVPPIFCCAALGTPQGSDHAVAFLCLLSLRVSFNPAKKVSGCRAAPGKPSLIEEKTVSTTAAHNELIAHAKRELFIDHDLLQRYSRRFPEKEGNRFDSLTPTAQKRRNAVFCCTSLLRLLWVAMVGRLRPAGCCRCRSVNPAICRPPRLTAGSGSLLTYRRPSWLIPIHLHLHPHLHLKPKPSPPTHQDFHWIHGPARETPLADFLELAHDVSAGIHTCLQVIYSGDLVREVNQDAEAGNESPPAIGCTDAAHLMRLSIAASGMLHTLSEQRIDWLNQAKVG